MKQSIRHTVTQTDRQREKQAHMEREKERHGREEGFTAHTATVKMRQNTHNGSTRQNSIQVDTPETIWDDTVY